MTNKNARTPASFSYLLATMKSHSLHPRAALLLVMLSCTTSAEEWQTIKPAVTPEAEVVRKFGPPDEVISTFPWVEWSATWKKRPKADHYILRYSRYSGKPTKSELLNGPGGPADEVDVKVSGGIVHSVEWHYGGPLAHEAAAALRANATITLDGPHEISRAFGRTEYGVLVGEIGPEDTEVDVRLELK